MSKNSKSEFVTEGARVLNTPRLTLDNFNQWPRDVAIFLSDKFGNMIWASKLKEIHTNPLELNKFKDSSYASLYPQTLEEEAKAKIRQLIATYEDFERTSGICWISS